MNHTPVLLNEVLHYWHKHLGGEYVDCTLGSGGHTFGLLKTDPKARCLGIDLDPQALNCAKNRLREFENRLAIIQGNYTDLPKFIKRLGWEKVSGILLDLGASSLQFDNEIRGFSFMRGGPLDMRMDPSQKLTAQTLIQDLSEKDLAHLISNYGEEIHSKRIAHALKEGLKKVPDLDTVTCAQIIANCIPLGARRLKIHPATKSFQALRIGVNHELENLKNILEIIPEWIAKGGRLLVITFHSLEDRCVKVKALQWEKPCICPATFPKCVCGKTPLFKGVTPKPIRPSIEEIQKNPRSRSAKLRIYERV